MVKIKSTNKCDLVVEELLNSISSGVYPACEKLPSENVLAEQMGVSRVTIRESLKKLSMMNIISIKQGEGTYVNELSLDSFMKPIMPMLILDNVKMVELFDARFYVETGTAFLAAQNCTTQQIEKLKLMLLEMKKAQDNRNQILYADLDTEFHLYIGQMSNNSILLRTYKTIRDILQIYLQNLNNYYPAVEASYEWHCKIVDALSRNDAEKAKEYIGQHILEAKAFWFDYTANNKLLTKSC
jgi:GntR family transcriptional repressor for pyruvate dehydrogenase complex